MNVSDKNRGYWSGTNTETGETATGATKEEVRRQLGG
jgi:hypothetical protein